MRVVLGNTDRYVVASDRPFRQSDTSQETQWFCQAFAEVAHTFAWTQDAIPAAGWSGFLPDLPAEQRLDLRDGTRVIGVHVAPGGRDGAGIHSRLSDVALHGLLAPACADLLCVDHPLRIDRQVRGIRVSNTGSMSNPLAPNFRLAVSH